MQNVAGRSLNRRTFYTGAIYGLWGIIAAALGAPALVYLLLPPRTRKESEWVEAGEVSRLSPGVPTELTYRRNRVDGWKVISEKSTAWVVRNADQSVVAFGPQCTHLGCAYHWEEARHQFVCPCHASFFSLEGRVAAGPAPRPLDRFAVRVAGGKILLGSLQRSEEKGA
jgi:menaquinol-cytochrome c reductase iron-sulfur subunit